VFLHVVLLRSHSMLPLYFGSHSLTSTQKRSTYSRGGSSALLVVL
jgi:hypothetical protein